MPSVVRIDIRLCRTPEPSWPLCRLHRCSSRRQIPAPLTAARFLRIYSAGNIIDWRSIGIAVGVDRFLLNLLTEPKWPVYALSAKEWKSATDAGVHELPEPVAGAREWQLWRYSPVLMLGAATVAPISLVFSLQDNPDDRIQLARDEVRGQLPW